MRSVGNHSVLGYPLVFNLGHAQNSPDSKSIYEERVMTHNLKSWRHTITMVGLTFGLMISPTYADSSGQPTIHGRTYGEWSAKWWQWVRSIPDPDGQSNPLTSSGQVDCSVAQSGPVWFLAGTKGGAPVTRECTVPQAKELFFSPLNAVFYNDPADPPPPPDVPEKRAALDDSVSGACNLKITVDGENIVFSAIALARTQSPPFRLTIGEQDVFGGTAGTVDSKAVADGFWMMLRLPPGKHTLHVQGAVCDQTTHEPTFQQDYTYILHVQ
jgi:hypothetical protein